MARLNEPAAPLDGSDILRKKLLRQNRDLAKSNANHAMRVRILEQEKQQLINQKLELASRVLELEQKIERNAAQRIADQVLEIRAKLEAQLSDCMSILGDLGQEPPRKRRLASSPRSGRISRPRLSGQHRTPPRRRIFESEKDAEMRALSEGRLVPIFEPQHDSRQTLNPEQIMALCSAAADAADSPELGPPPMSRFVDVDDEPVKPPSPHSSPSPIKKPDSPVNSDQPLPPPTENLIKTTESAAPVVETPPIDPMAPSKERTRSTKVAEALRTSSKRKFGTNDTNDQTPKILVSDTPGMRITSVIRGEQKSKNLKELASVRRETREKPTALGETRKPLSAKSTNKDLNSPKKTTKPPLHSEPYKTSKRKDNSRKHEGKCETKASDIIPIIVPLVPLELGAPVEDALLARGVAEMESVLLSPGSPAPSAPRPHDTPPPADISAMGETARPSRRARAAVSYAEPNLRDKMRRPTKELFDAVAGEGRFKPRNSSSRLDDVMSVGASSASRAFAERHVVGMPSAAEALEQPETPSPLSQKSLGETDRNQRVSSTPVKADHTEHPTEVTSGKEVMATKPSVINTRPTVDPYDFASSSPDKEATNVPGDKPKPARRQVKSSRRLSSVPSEDFHLDDAETKPKHKSAAGKKRASIANARADPTVLEEENLDLSGSTDGGEAVPRPAGRRRSMMV